MIRRYLLDTGIAQDFQDDRHGVRARVDAQRHLGHRIGICHPVLGELWSGIEGSATRAPNLKRLKHMLSRLFIWPYDDDAAEEYGRIFTELKRAGRAIQQVDMQIARLHARFLIASLCRRIPT
jgi:tRNA(fMet)-specific endonuclease VapC